MSAETYAFLGAGKVATALHRALRAAGKRSRIHPARRDFPRAPWDVSVLVLAVRDHDIAPLAARLAREQRVSRRTVVVHLSGVLSSSALAPLSDVCAGVAQMHPLVSFASKDDPPPLAGAHMHLEGSHEAVRRARHLASSIGMRPRLLPGVDPTGYHASAVLVASGTVTLAAAAIELLVQSGVPRELAPSMLAPLLHSVAANLQAVGLPTSLTGPVRRGDMATIERHLRVIDEHARVVTATTGPGTDDPPAHEPTSASGTIALREIDVGRLYRDVIRAQIPLAMALGEASVESLATMRQRIGD